MTATPRQHAFTLMELIVAISIASVMLLMINILFQQSVRAVNLGAGTSRILQQSNTINTQLAADFGANSGEVVLRNSLVGAPNDDRNVTTPPPTGPQAITEANRVGFLMIAHNQIQNPQSVSGAHTNMTYPVPANINESNEVYYDAGERGIAFFPDDSDGDGDADIRSDQLVFLRNLYDGERSITPQNDESIGNDTPIGAARIWYGHVVPTNDAGDAANDNPGATDYDFYNRPANQWVLGRQALYFSEFGAGSGPDGLTAESVASELPASDTVYNATDDLRVDAVRTEIIGSVNSTGLSDGPGGSNYSADTGTYRLDYNGRLAFSDDPVLGTLPAEAPSPALLHHGLTDIVPARVDELFHVADTGAGYAATGPLNAELDPLVAADNSAYAERAARLGYTFDRLWVNPRPHDAAGNPARLVEAWQQAQMHPYLAAGVSDFEVHFAGDYDDDDDPTNIPATFDNRIDLDSDGNIRWYNSYDASGDLIVPPLKTDVALADQPQLPILRRGTTPFPISTTGPTTPSPLSTLPNHADLIWAWRHDEPQSWPDLIRIRYRIHDAAGRVSDRQVDNDYGVDKDGDGDFRNDNDVPHPGRLVEVIYRVPG
ncbi:MAG: type II secretion system protein [Planctomycetota bacterium]